MTDLTQDWKDRKLEAGLYYVKYNDGKCGKSVLISKPYFYGFFSSNDKIAAVLAEVPDYTAWQNMWNTADMEHKANNKLLEDVERLEQENKQLEKDLAAKFTKYLNGK